MAILTAAAFCYTPGLVPSSFTPHRHLCHRRLVLPSNRHLLQYHHVPLSTAIVMNKSIATKKRQEQLENELISSLNPRSYVISSTDADYETIESLITDIEKCGGFTTSTASIRNLFVASWTLIGTNARAVIRNNGGLTGFPTSRCSRVQVILRNDGKALTIEYVSLFFNLVKSRISLSGKWSIEKRDSLQVTYATALMFDRWNMRADSKAVLKTTYCSKRLRIGRSANCEFYIFIRDDESTTQQ